VGSERAEGTVNTIAVLDRLVTARSPDVDGLGAAPAPLRSAGTVQGDGARLPARALIDGPIRQCVTGLRCTINDLGGRRRG